MVSTEAAEVVVTCEWFAHDGGYWEPATEETYQYQWVCDGIPDHGGVGAPPQTIVNPVNTSELARRR